MADASSTPAPHSGERLAKVIARAGLCSRRDAEKWIADGRVNVDGKRVTSPVINVTGAEVILVDGEPLAARHGTRLWLYHKPAGLVVTEKDPEGRPTIFPALAEKGLPRVITVGRLDINTEGLLLLTNDGGLKRVLELPSTGWLRKYRVRAFGSIDQARLDTLKAGMTVDGVTYGPIEAVLERVQGGNVWLLVSLREGKNREVKNVLGALGLVVNRLIRVSYGPFQLGDMPVGAVSLVKAKVLRDQLGDRLAAEAAVDFDSAFPDDLVAKTPQKPTRNPRDPNARLRGRPERPVKSAPAPKPKTGEPRFAKQRAEGKAPPKSDREPRRFDEPKPAMRRVLFDDGRELLEEAPRVRRDRDDRPSGDGERPFSKRGDRPDRAPADRKGPPRSGDRSQGRPDGRPQSRGEGRSSFRKDDKPSFRGGDKPQSRSGGRPGGRSGDRPGGKPFGKPSGPRRGGGKPSTPRGRER